MSFWNNCCCCAEPSTLWRVNAAGSVVWRANFYADFGAYSLKAGNKVFYQYPNGVGLQSDQDDVGHSYQVGYASVPVDGIAAHSQPTIDTIRCYNSAGVKVWGWSDYPTGVISGALRSQPPMPTIAVTADGTTIATTFISAPTQQFYGLDNTGSVIWSKNFSIASSLLVGYGSLWKLEGAGSNYALVTSSNAGAHGTYAYLVDKNTGSITQTFDQSNVSGSFVGGRTNFAACIDRSDNVYYAYTNSYDLAYKGAAIVYGRVTNSGGVTGAAWATVCQYVRFPVSIHTDGTYVVISGSRQYNPYYSDLSYLDSFWVAEVYNAATGALVKVLWQHLDIGGFRYQRHSSGAGGIAPSQIGNGWLVYSQEIFAFNPAANPAEFAFANWSNLTACGRIAADGSSTWHGGAWCENILSPVLSGHLVDCLGSFTYTVQPTGPLVWIPSTPLNACPPGCYLPSPSAPPVTRSDTFTAICQAGTVCTGNNSFSSLIDTGPSLPSGTSSTFYAWNIANGVSGSCSAPCLAFPAPSFRPANAGLTIQVPCE